MHGMYTGSKTLRMDVQELGGTAYTCTGIQDTEHAKGHGNQARGCTLLALNMFSADDASEGNPGYFPT